MKTNYNEIITHYENCLEKHGDNHLGVDWPKIEDVDTRYRIMLDIIRYNNDNISDVSLLDFGCGTAHLFEYLTKNKLSNIIYSGLDISEKFIQVSKNKYPQLNFYCNDVLVSSSDIPNFDYIVMNGVFTEKRNLSFEEMWDYFKELISIVYQKCDKGFAFNVMSKNVEWERDDLFYLPHDLLTQFLCEKISRNYIIRNDYGLYEYTVYIFKK